MREAADTVARLAAAFVEAGIGEGTRIAVVGSNSPWHYIAHVTPTCSHMEASETEGIRGDSGTVTARSHEAATWTM